MFSAVTVVDVRCCCTKQHDAFVYDFRLVNVNLGKVAGVIEML